MRVTSTMLPDMGLKCVTQPWQVWLVTQPITSCDTLSGSIVWGISSWSGIRISGLGGSDTYQNRNMCIYKWWLTTVPLTLLPHLYDCLLQDFCHLKLLLPINFCNVSLAGTSLLMSPMPLRGQSLEAQWTHLSFILIPFPGLPVLSPVAHWRKNVRQNVLSWSSLLWCQ